MAAAADAVKASCVPVIRTNESRHRFPIYGLRPGVRPSLSIPDVSVLCGVQAGINVVGDLYFASCSLLWSSNTTSFDHNYLYLRSSIMIVFLAPQIQPRIHVLVELPPDGSGRLPSVRASGLRRWDCTADGAYARLAESGAHGP